jgi:hypothetical protein
MKYFALFLMLPTAIVVGLFGFFYKELYKKPIFKNGWFLVIFNLLIWFLIGILIFRWIF